MTTNEIGEQNPDLSIELLRISAEKIRLENLEILEEQTKGGDKPETRQYLKVTLPQDTENLMKFLIKRYQDEARKLIESRRPYETPEAVAGSVARDEVDEIFLIEGLYGDKSLRDDLAVSSSSHRLDAMSSLYRKQMGAFQVLLLSAVLYLRASDTTAPSIPSTIDRLLSPGDEKQDPRFIVFDSTGKKELFRSAGLAHLPRTNNPSESAK